METKYTPTPWRLGLNSKTEAFDDKGRFPHPIFEVHPRRVDAPDNLKAEGDANAAFIVRACNSHEALTRAVRLLAAMVAEEGEQYDALLEAEWDSAAHQEREPSTAKLKADILKEAQAALALAESK